MCGVKNALRTVEDRKSWRKTGGGGGVGEITHELEKNAKMLEKENTMPFSYGEGPDLAEQIQFGFYVTK